MDKLLCLLDKYNCHLKRENKTSVDFLRENYNEYIRDLKAASNVEDNKLVGLEMCDMVLEQIKNIENNAKLLMRSVKSLQ